MIGIGWWFAGVLRKPANHQARFLARKEVDGRKEEKKRHPSKHGTINQKFKEEET